MPKTPCSACRKGTDASCPAPAAPTHSPARPDVAAQVYNSAIMVKMISKVSQGGESIEAVIKSAEHELEGFLRT